MRKFRVAVTVLLSLALLIAGAFIPKFVSCFLDWRTTGKESLNSMASVELNIYQELTSTGKLAMMNRLDNLFPISESKAKMTGEEVMDAVYEGLIPYIDTRIVTYYENTVDIHPYLVQVLDIPELQRVVWQVTVGEKEFDYTAINLLIDDDTGKILQINYTADNPQNPYDTYDTLTIFADIFFSSLGIEDHWTHLVEDLEYAFTGDNTVAVQFRFEDQQYGEINVDLCVHENGFYIEFPNIS